MSSTARQVNPVTTRYCSNVVLAGTFNADLYAGRGTMMGEDGMWSGYMINYNIGNDLHRTPFGGRNFEYMSECPILNYLAGAVEVEAMEKTGSHAGPKHFVGNDQEFYREGLVCFFNEQAFREGNLKAFEGSIRVANAGGLMQSFERLGLKWYSASYAMNTTILRNEWGWNGAIDTDAAPALTSMWTAATRTMQPKFWMQARRNGAWTVSVATVSGSCRKQRIPMTATCWSC